MKDAMKGLIKSAMKTVMKNTTNNLSNPILISCTTCCWLLFTASVQAQDTINLDQFSDEVAAIPASAISAALNDSSKTYAKGVIANAVSERFKFLDLAYVQADDENKNDGWNAKYNWQYQRNNGGGFSVDSGTATLKDVAFGIDIDGTYSYGSADNTEDYSSAKVSFTYLYGKFGQINAITRAASDEFQDCLIEAGQEEDQERMLAAEDRCWVTHRIDNIVSDPSSAYVFSLAATAGLEGDQSYDNQQSTYGVTGIYSHSDLPTLHLNFEKVDASDDEERMALTDENTYDRFSAELGYRYELIDTQGANTWLYLSYRYFKEISAPGSISDAGLDEFDFLSASIRFPSKILGFVETDKINFYLRYTEGQLPFDRQSDKSIQLGFSTDIATLAGLIAQ